MNTTIPKISALILMLSGCSIAGPATGVAGSLWAKTERSALEQRVKMLEENLENTLGWLDYHMGRRWRGEDEVKAPLRARVGAR